MAKARLECVVTVRSKDGKPVHAAGWAEVNWIPMNCGVEIAEDAHVYTVDEFKVMHGNGYIVWPALFLNGDE